MYEYRGTYVFANTTTVYSRNIIINYTWWIHHFVKFLARINGNVSNIALILHFL